MGNRPVLKGKAKRRETEILSSPFTESLGWQKGGVLTKAGIDVAKDDRSLDVEFKETKKEDLDKVEKRLLKSIEDEDEETNNEIIENLEDSFHKDLTSYYGNEDPKRIKRLIKKLKNE